MSVKFSFGKLDIVRIVIALALAVTGAVAGASQFWDCIIWYVLLFLISLFTFEFKDSGKARYVQIAFDVILPVIASFFSIYFMQMINLAGHSKVLQFNALYMVMYHGERTRWFYEVTIIIALYFFFRFICFRRRAAAVATPVLFMILGIANYFIYCERGHEFLVTDLQSFGTAMNVVSNYRLDFKAPLLYVVIPFALYCIAMLRFKGDKRILPIPARVAVFAALSCAFTAVFIVNLKTFGKSHSLQAWEDKGSAYNGFMLNLSLSALTMFPEAREGYTVDDLNANIDSLGIDLTDKGSADDASNVIVIMNESYMQARDYTIMLGCYEDPTPYWNSLEENTIHGYALSSVYGGNTPNSEFEFLTGISTAFLPTGTIPYSSYIKNDTYSLAWALRDMGYSTCAMHPYLASGWNRPTVYPLIGFQEYKFIDDFNYTDADLYREYVSDKCAYQNLIDRLEASKGQKTFNFLVTMQNHGGYTEVYPNMPLHEYVSYVFSGEKTQVNTYLTAINKSDEALEFLLDYLKGCDEKYTVLVFGDHQPKMQAFNNNFAPGRNSSYIVPYIIWTNYDMDPSLMEGHETGEEVTSLNYLSLDVMRAAGIKMPAYYQVIDSIKKDLPSINANGYYSKNAKKYAYINDVADQGDNRILDFYHDIQYSLLFDKKDSKIKSFAKDTINEVKGNG
ncbi:MAG: LTA synthase family protein [Clostridiales bacterium]|nr:LTA synthase family protein [Clostridiales bacterium]MBO4580019.1 LTA synthase family protein [Clostridiales bacterium]